MLQPCSQKVSITNGQHHEHQLGIFGSAGTRSAANRFGLAIHQSSSRASPCKYLVWRTRTASITSISCELLLATQSTGHHHEISLETLGSGTHERPASPASAANCFWPRNQQVIITRSAWKHLGLAHTNGQHHQHQLRIVFGPAINRSSSRDQLGNTSAWHTRTASITSISCELLLAPQSTGHHHEISLETLGPGTHHQHQLRIAFGPAINRSSSRDQIGNTWAWHTRMASITSISCELLWPCNQQVIITRSDWKHLGLAHTNGQHHQHQLRIALAPQSTGHHHEISLETLGPGTRERPASPASAANCFGPAINRSSSRDQLENTWAWHTRTASITSISCELLWPRNQQVIITRSAWKHLGLAHTNGQHHQHQLRIALAPQSTGHHHEIRLETLGPGTHERPASPASAANCFGPTINRSSSRDQVGNTWAWHTRTASIASISCELLLAPQSTGHHHEISLETLGPGTHERPASPASAANCFGPAINRSSSRDQLGNTLAPKSTSQHNEHQH